MSCRIVGLTALRELEAQAEQVRWDLMQRAAIATARWVSLNVLAQARVLVCAGPGNNGGDALYAALELASRDYSIEVYLPVPPVSVATQQALITIQQKGIPVYTELPFSYREPDWVIDGWFGIGLTRALDASWIKRIEQINAWRCPILALDCPSGLDAYTGQIRGAALCAQYTLTFLSEKPGLYMAAGADVAGKVECTNLAVPLSAMPLIEGRVYAGEDAVALRRPKDSHKGLQGTIGIIGGAKGMVGAPLLCGRGALRSGAGKVFVGLLEECLPVDTTLPELMLHSATDVLALTGISHWVIGPGLGMSSDLALADWLNLHGKLVLDADALNRIAQDATLEKQVSTRAPGSTILTPHPAEAARLLGCCTEQVQQDRLAAAQTLAKRYQSLVILKGAGSLIVQPNGYYHVNPTGGSALSVAGQGDVLSGVIAALWAQRLDGFQAASLAVYVHGLAGSAYEREQGGPIGLLASETADRISVVLNRLLATSVDVKSVK